MPAQSEYQRQFSWKGFGPRVLVDIASLTKDHFDVLQQRESPTALKLHYLSEYSKSYGFNVGLNMRKTTETIGTETVEIKTVNQQTFTKDADVNVSPGSGSGNSNGTSNSHGTSNSPVAVPTRTVDVSPIPAIPRPATTTTATIATTTKDKTAVFTAPKNTAVDKKSVSGKSLDKDNDKKGVKFGAKSSALTGHENFEAGFNPNPVSLASLAPQPQSLALHSDPSHVSSKPPLAQYGSANTRPATPTNYLKTFNVLAPPDQVYASTLAKVHNVAHFANTDSPTTATVTAVGGGRNALPDPKAVMREYVKAKGLVSQVQRMWRSEYSSAYVDWSSNKKVVMNKTRDRVPAGIETGAVHNKVRQNRPREIDLTAAVVQRDEDAKHLMILNPIKEKENSIRVRGKEKEPVDYMRVQSIYKMLQEKGKEPKFGE